MSRYRVSMDIGGTFTDVVAYDEATGRYVAGKSSTTPADLTEGILAAVEQVVESPADIAFTVHGTTQGLNAFLQRRGEKVMLLATQGAGDVYHIARGNRLRLYDVHYRKPTPLVPRSDIVEIPGRLNWAGEELAPLDEDAIRAAAARYRDEKFGAIAVGFLFSYLNPAHELRAAEILTEELGNVPISLSHGVAREWREYERTSSAVIDAYTSGRVAMADFIGARLLAIAKQNNPPVGNVTGTTPLAYHKGPGNRLAAQGYMTFQKSRNKDLAKQLVRFLADQKRNEQFLWSTAMHVLPASSDTFRGGWRDNDFVKANPDVLKTIEASWDYGHSPVYDFNGKKPAWQRVRVYTSTTYNKIISAVVAGGVAPDEAIDDGAAAARQLIRRG